MTSAPEAHWEVHRWWRSEDRESRSRGNPLEIWKTEITTFITNSNTGILAKEIALRLADRVIAIVIDYDDSYWEPMVLYSLQLLNVHL